jgi:hypothetical protein
MMSRRARAFRLQASWHATQVRIFQGVITLCRKQRNLGQQQLGRVTYDGAMEAYARKHLVYHIAMKRECDWAARFPWSTLAPNPPEVLWGGTPGPPKGRPAARSARN